MRIIAHVVAASGEPRLGAVLERISFWADETCVVFDGTVDRHSEDWDIAVNWATQVGSVEPLLDIDEGRARTAAWRLMEGMVQPEVGDYIFLIEPYEVVVEHDQIRARLKTANAEAFPVLVHHMWNENEYRTDGYYRPAPFWALIPWRQGGEMRKKTVLSGREPTYVHSDASLVKVQRVVCNVLSYAHSSEEDRKRSDATYRLRSPELPNWHMSSAVMKEWDKGGLL